MSLLHLLILTLPILSKAFVGLKPPQSRGKVLVLVEDVAFSSRYGQYLEQVRGLGYDIETRSATDKDLHLREWDAWLYSKLIIFASGIKAFGGALDSEAILDFIDAGHDLILAADSRVSDEIRNLASDLGVDFEPRGSTVNDIENHVLLPHSHDPTLIISDAFLENAAVWGPEKLMDPVIFRGIGATFSPDNEQVMRALGGKRTHCMANLKKNFTDEIQVVGKDISLVLLVQTRNDARVAVTGSMDMFKPECLQATDIQTQGGEKYLKSGNEQFLRELTKWVFHERSVLRATNLRHHPPGTLEQPEHYRITDDLEFEVDIHEFRDGQWRPYQASDVQLEFVMLDPYIRTFLSHDGAGRFFVRFKVPDVYGVFKFVIDYKREGLTPIELQQQISVRPFRHNEFERFISAAYPYYVSAFSCMVAFWIFGFVFLYHRDK